MRLHLLLTLQILTLCFVAPAAPAVAHTGDMVAAYGFDEGAGPVVGDLSGHGHSGTIQGAVWTTDGYFDGALEFDGVSSMVVVQDAELLQLTTGMTLEAWVYPTSLPNSSRNIIFKANDDYYLNATSWPDGLPKCGSDGFTEAVFGTSKLPLNSWTHLASTFDGSMLRFFVNGAAVDSSAQAGPMPVSGSPLTFGGHELNGQHFQGRIDEIRIYDYALTEAEIQADMLAPIPLPPDTTPPIVSITPPQSSPVGGVVQVEITATDDVDVVGVELFVDSISIGSDVSPPFTVNWNTTASVNGSYTLTASAFDLAGNEGVSAPLVLTTENPWFSNEVVAPDIPLATTMAFLPDGRMLVGELTGEVWVIQPGASVPDAKPFLQLDYSSLVGEQGLMELILDPDFANNDYLYLFYTHPAGGKFDRVSRFTAGIDSVEAGSEFVLWQDPAVSHDFHHGSGMGFGPDGMLYIGVGDHFNAPDAQLLTSYHGKILRIAPDGSIPLDNPFADGAGGNLDEIWAYGFRNPWRLAFDPFTGRLFIGDVGGNDDQIAEEEVNEGFPGANYGWPLCEGACGDSTITDPIFSYPHQNRDASVTGGFFMRGGSYPPEYEGNYFFGDYARNQIRRLTFDGAGNLIDVVDFEPPDGTADGNYGDPVKLLQGPDGALYYVDIGTDMYTSNESGIRRIRFAIDDLAPVVTASATPDSGLAPLLVNFSTAGSYDPEGNPLSYNWNFGDTGSSTDPNPSHSYTANGEYVARVTVSDGSNFVLSDPLPITVGISPTAQITAPQDSMVFEAGDIINFSGVAFDGVGVPLGPSAFTWNVLFHHNTHVHPVAGPITNTTTGSFEIPTTGHDFSGDTSFEVVLDISDPDGLTTAESVTVYPKKVDITFETDPASLEIDVDGIRRSTPFVFDTLVGFQHTLNAPAQLAAGLPYTFEAWSDSGAQTHDIVVPTSPATWVATFVPAAGVTGLVAAYSFDEGSGTSVLDESGFDNTGTLDGATWTTEGKFGNALVFNGTDASVVVADAASLQLTGGMTLEAWIYPNSLPVAWKDIVFKWNDDYFLMASSTPSGHPATGSVSFGSPLYGSAALPLNDWIHLASTYDGTTMRLYVDGVEVSSAPRSGDLGNSGGPLSFGGDGLFGQYFDGRIDEVRIYNRALTPEEIQTDMISPVSSLVPVEPAPRPTNSALIGAFPNPFNPTTRIRFRLESSADARLRIFNVAGRQIRSYDLSHLLAGEHELAWRGDDSTGSTVASGVYLVLLESAGGKDTLRIALLK